MEDIQVQHERAVGDEFISWYNQKYGKAFVYSRRPGTAPDLLYSNGNDELSIEVGSAYYDHKDAIFQWKNARGAAGAPTSWEGTDFDAALIDNINNLIYEKTLKQYGSRCILVISVISRLTTAADMETLRGDIRIPKNSFDAIYLTGNFPFSRDSQGGYRCWRLA